MVGRIRRYTQNVGPGVLVINILIFSYLGYIIFRTSTSSLGGMMFGAVVILPAATIGLIGPLLVLPWLITRAEQALSFARFLGFVVWAFILLRLFVLQSMHWAVSIAIVQCVFLSIGITFWLLSDKRVATGRGVVSEIRRQDRAAGEATARGIAAAWQPREDGRTVGTRGPAGGEIVHDFDYKGEARITLEQVRHDKWTITSRVDGVLDHTRSLASPKAAQRDVESMMMPLGSIAFNAQHIDDEAGREEVAEACEQFFARFPPDRA